MREDVDMVDEDPYHREHRETQGKITGEKPSGHVFPCVLPLCPSVLSVVKNFLAVIFSYQNCGNTLLVRGCRLSGLRRQRAIRFRTPVSIKLPDFPHFLDHIEIEIGDQHFVFIAAGLGEDLAARIAEVTLAVKLSDIPRLFSAYAIDRSYEVAVRRGVRGLFEFP